MKLHPEVALEKSSKDTITYKIRNIMLIKKRTEEKRKKENDARWSLLAAKLTYHKSNNRDHPSHEGVF